MKDNSILYLSNTDVTSAGLGMREIIEALQLAFAEKGAGRVEMPPKPGVHPGGGDNFIHAMPAHIPALEATGIKWVSGFPGNNNRGLPYISGLIILNNPNTGIPIAVMDCAWVTAMRTGAATAIAARHLARPESSVAGILGCGVQGRTNLEALVELFPLKKVMAYDTGAQSSLRFASEMSTKFGLEVIPVDNPRAAVSECDIIVTAGPIVKPPHCTIQPGWMKEGAFASLVDFDSYWHPAAVNQATKFCTDELLQMKYYIKEGYFQGFPQVYADLGELVTGKKPGRQNEQERTFTANLGLGMEDIVTASLVYKRALELDLGTWLPH